MRKQASFWRRWLRLGLLAALCSSLIVGSSLGAEPESHASSRVALANGGDVSWLPQIEREGSTFRTATGKRVDALTLMRSAGLKVARVRLWVDPPSQGSSLPEVLRLAKRIKAAKLDLVLDLHYSDWWADPANQKIPEAWSNLSQAGLVERVRDYTSEVLGEFVAQGTPPAWVQIGNEIGNGLLWPNGQLGDWSAERFAAMTKLLNAGASAVRSASPKSKIMIHLETGGDAVKTRNWLKAAFSAGLTRPDGVGLSYYSVWSGPVGNLEAALRVVAVEFGLPVAVAETAYPSSSRTEPKPLLDPTKSRLAGFSLSQSGQAAYATRISQVLRAAAGTKALGVWWWEVFAPNASRGSSGLGPSVVMYSSLVTGDGRANPAMAALGKASR